MVDYRSDLPPRPARMERLPLDPRGYPIPYFVGYTKDGTADFRLADPLALRQCIVFKKCWLCGQPLGSKASFVVGPMCIANKVSSEPPSHDDCARYAVAACPHLTRPHAKRRSANLPEDRKKPAGIMVETNPGVCVLYQSRNWHTIKAGGGQLINIGDALAPPEWFCEGRPASREEAEAAFNVSTSTLLAFSLQLDGPEGERAAKQEIERARKLLPRAA